MSANNASELLFDVVDPLSIPEEAFEGLFDRARVIAYPYAVPSQDNGAKVVAIGPDDQEARPWQEGWVSYGSLTTEGDPHAALHEYCRSLGYVGLVGAWEHAQYVMGPYGVSRKFSAIIELCSREKLRKTQVDLSRP